MGVGGCNTLFYSPQARTDAPEEISGATWDHCARWQDSTASIAELTSETEELTTKISSAEADLNEATSVRTDGRTDFEAQEKELVETVRGQRDSTMWGRDTRADESGAGS